MLCAIEAAARKAAQHQLLRGHQSKKIRHEKAHARSPQSTVWMRYRETGGGLHSRPHLLPSILCEQEWGSTRFAPEQRDRPGEKHTHMSAN